VTFLAGIAALLSPYDFVHKSGRMASREHVLASARNGLRTVWERP